MKQLNEISFDSNLVSLADCHVTTSILPRKSADVSRDIEIAGECNVDGAVFARNFFIKADKVSIKGPVYAENDFLVQSSVSGVVVFLKSVACGKAITALLSKGRCVFGADINADTVKISNAFVAANIFASEIVLENCVVLGGVFATKSASLTNCVLGTINAPRVIFSQKIISLLPSLFSTEPFKCDSTTKIECFTLADLGALMKGFPQSETSGKIIINPETDLQRITLEDDDGNKQVFCTYSVGGKVLAADMLDFEKLQNHFLITIGILGSQVLRNYDLGLDAKGDIVVLTQSTIADFMFKLLKGDFDVCELSGKFDIKDIVSVYNA